MSVLEELADSKQIFRPEQSSNAVFTPKATTRLSSTERLSRDVNSIFETAESINKDRMQLSQAAIERVAMEDYATLKRTIDRIDEVKNPSVHRADMINSMGMSLGEITKSFDDKDKQAAYDKVFTTNALNLVSGAQNKWKLEQRGIDARVTINNVNEKASILKGAIKEEHLKIGREAYASAEKAPLDYDRYVADRLNDSYTTYTRDNIDKIINKDGTINKKLLKEQFNDTYGVFAEYKDGELVFKTEDSITREKITKALNLINKDVGVAAKDSSSKFKSEMLSDVKRLSYDGKSDVVMGVEYKYVGEQELANTLIAKYGEDAVRKNWTSIVDARKAQDDKNAKEKNFIMSNPFVPMSGEQKSTMKPQLKKEWTSIESGLRTAEGKDRENLINNTVYQIKNQRHDDNFVNAIKDNYIGDSKLGIGTIEPIMKEIIESPTGIGVLVDSLTTDEYRDFVVSRYMFNSEKYKGKDISEESKKFIKEPKALTQEQLNKLAALRYGDINFSAKRWRTAKALYEIGMDKDAEMLISDEVSKYNYNSENYSYKGAKIHLAESNTLKTILHSNKLANYDNVNKVINGIIDVLPIKDIAAKNGVNIYPADPKAYKSNTSNHKYMLRAVGDPTGTTYEIDLEHAYRNIKHKEEPMFQKAFNYLFGDE